ncbi:MAG TPA: cytochrome c [Candidatus Limnocylindrales bacterium]|nr:cytochrome c [Candidatus Limnocylindrales bacterium]
MRTDVEVGVSGLGRRRLWLAAAAVALLGASACRQDMHDQPKSEPLEASLFFRDGQASRPIVEGTVARGQLRLDAHRETGKVDGQLVETFPAPVTRATLDRGQQRYGIFCAPCHGRVGDGQGMVARRGLKRLPATFHSDRLRQAPPGYFFDVMTNGFGAMQDYRSQVPVDDRWAIVAYLRVLQLSQHATVDDVPAAERATLDAPAASAARTGEESHR